MYSDGLSESERRYAKWDAIKARGGVDAARCDLTGKRIGQRGDLHELIPRSMTVGNRRARRLSYVPHLCAYISHDAHMALHGEGSEPSTETRDRLFRKLYEIYGYARVRAAFDRLANTMTGPLTIQLPEQEEDHGPTAERR